MNTEMETQTFGIEVETAERSQAEVASAIATHMNARITDPAAPRWTTHYAGGSYNTTEVVMPDGRRWKCMSDASIRSNNGKAAEVVTPILKGTADLEMAQEVIRAVREAGAKVNPSCGIHIHIGVGTWELRQIQNLAKLVFSNEDLLVAALQVQQQRLDRYCQKITPERIQALSRARTMEELNQAWYGYRNTNPTHYDGTRYHGLNLHNIWFRGTVEFRYFEATLHAGKIKAYVHFALALAAKAKGARSAQAKRRPFNQASAKYDFRCWLLRLGLIGDEFKTARLHLLDAMPGDAAFKGGRPAAPAPEAVEPRPFASAA